MREFPEWLQWIANIFLAVAIIAVTFMILFLVVGGAVMLVHDVREERREREEWKDKDITMSD